jgi:tetratricopeptide (TPR) repeat protein
MAFGLLTLLGYIRYTEVPSRGRMALVTALLALGLMAKPMLVTLPFVLLLLDWWPLRRIGSPSWIASPEVAPGKTPGVRLGWTPARIWTKGGRLKRRYANGGRELGPKVTARLELPEGSFDHGDARIGRALSGRRLLLEKAPLFAVALLSCGVTYLVQKAGGVVLEWLTVLFRLENAVHSYVVYLEKFVFPTHLAFFYPMIDLGEARIALSITTLVAITLIAWRLRTTRPYALVGWLWFVGALVPVIGFVQVGAQAYADRYTYFPSLGLGFAASLGLADFGRARLPRPTLMLAGGALLAVLGVATWKQTLVWRDTVTLFEHAVTASEHNWFIRLLLSEEYIERNEFTRAEGMLRQSLSNGAPPASTHWRLSVLYDRMQQEEDALREIDAALDIEPDNYSMLVDRGFYLTEMGRDAEAVATLQRAIALDRGHDPSNLEPARRLLATAQSRLGRSAERVQESESGGVSAPPR